jgi:hypothetical protein
MILACGALTPAAAAEPPKDPLAAGFLEPPPEARPLVFWQWINGNVSQEGIRLDLEWMQRIGIGGALMFDIGFSRPPVPQYVERRVGFGTPEWKQAVRFAASEARRLGLLLGAQSSGGWSVSSDPTVRPEQAMKKLVWSETIVTPDTPASLKLPSPPANNGPYQDLPIDNARYLEPRATGEVAVIALRLPEAEQRTAPKTEVSGVPDVSLLDDGSYSRTTELVPDERGYAWLYARPQAAPLSITLGLDARRAMTKGVIESSRDGVHYWPVAELPGPAAQSAPVVTFSTGHAPDLYWRIRFDGLETPLPITEARFETGARLHRAQEKAGYGTLTNYTPAPMYWMQAGATTNPAQVIDVTARLTSEGHLNWRPTEGRWAVLRFGWSLTGRRSVPATAESLGLEVDKLDAAAVRACAETLYGRYSQAIGDAGRLSIALTDSWEAGQQNWTQAMPEEFAKRRGYDLRPWLPVLTGRIIGDPLRSERFLADFRRTISDLLVENHYGVLADVAHRHGMQYVAEAPGTGTPTVLDGLAARGRVDIPAGEFWVYPPDAAPDPGHLADVRMAASAAHIYGLPQVAAESLTSRGEDPWALGPAQLRRMMDRFFAEGVNRVILHTSAHQPFTDRLPGMTLRQFGQHFTRNETWAEDAGAWIDYLARSSFLLQQGRPAADIAIYLGEDQPVSTEIQEELRDFRGFKYDFINAEALLARLRVSDGQLVLPDGVSYRMLVIAPQARNMSLAVIRRLRAMLEDGAVIVGRKPDALGLGDDEKAVRAISDEIWGENRGKVELARRPFGRGYLFTLPRYAFEKEPLMPDVDNTAPDALHWAHRVLPDADLYFLYNQNAQEFSGDVKFRVRGRHVELWDAVRGTRSPVEYRVGAQSTAVALKLAPWSSIFVVFRGEPAAGIDAKISPTREELLTTLGGAWQVQFLDGRGAPARAQISGSWTDHPDTGIRYYSGRGLYRRTLRVPAEWLAGGRRVELDLGDVREIAHVRVNDKDLGTWWSAPFRRDVTDTLRAGDNRVEITVTNYWVNRLIGDEQPGATRLTFAPIQPYKANSPLRPSGLLGPVRLFGGAPEETR